MIITLQKNADTQIIIIMIIIISTRDYRTRNNEFIFKYIYIFIKF